MSADAVVIHCDGTRLEPPIDPDAPSVPAEPSGLFSGAPVEPQGPIRITVVPKRLTRQGQWYEARLDERVLCETRTPFLSAARVLLAEGVDPMRMLEGRREGNGGRVDLRARVGVAAGLTVIEDERRGPVLARYRPRPVTFQEAADPHDDPSTGNGMADFAEDGAEVVS
jgi:hypothetical protein